MNTTCCAVVLVGALGAGCATTGSGEACTAANTQAAEARSAQARDHDAAVRLAADLAIAKESARRERAARIDAEVRAATLTYALAVADYNHVVATVVCDAVRGVKDPDAPAKLEAAGARVYSFTKGCPGDQPGDACVERMARDSASSAHTQ